MNKLEIEELERNLTENDSCKEEERGADDTGNNLGGEVRNILIALEADEEIGNFEEDEVAIIEEIMDMLERRHQEKLPALRDVPKKNLLQETAKVDKFFCVILKHIALQRLMNYFMLELLSLQIGWE